MKRSIVGLLLATVCVAVPARAVETDAALKPLLDAERSESARRPDRIAPADWAAMSDMAKSAIGVRNGRAAEPWRDAYADYAAPRTVKRIDATNVLVNDPTADATTRDTQSEAVIAMLSANVVAAAFNDSGSNAGGATHFVGFARSTDGGASFTDLGALPTSAVGDAGDPVLAYHQSSNRLYLATLGFSSQNGIQVFRSDDGGATYQAPINAFPGVASGSQDREWIAVDNIAGTGNGNVYVLARDFGTPAGFRFARSTDGGATFGASQLLTNAVGQGGVVAIGAGHTVNVVYYQDGAPATLRMRKSTDLGVTFAPETIVTNMLVASTNGDLGVGFRTQSFPRVVASATNPNFLAIAYSDNPAGADRGDIMFVASFNGGTSWSTPVRVNTDPGTNDQVMPSIAITPDGTRLFVGWYDRRRDPANSRLEYWGRIGTIGASAVTFGTDFLVSTSDFPVVIAQDSSINSVYMGGYDTPAADNSAFYVAWGDNRGPSATHANQPDVRLAKIPVTGPGATIISGAALFTSGACPYHDGVPDPGEQVAMGLCLKNIGSSSTVNLIGTLQAGGGIQSPSGPQTYGALANDGTSLCRDFTFTIAAAAACGGTVTATLALADGATNLGTAAYPITVGDFTLGGGGTFTNSAAIAIPAGAPTTTMGPASPYPSNITVAGLSGNVAQLTLTLHGLTHTFPSDIDVLLVSPSGQKMIVLSDTGNSADVAGIDITLDDAAPSIPTPPLVSGTFRPTDSEGGDVFAAPAPSGPYLSATPVGVATFASTFGGSNPNGTWSLYIVDDAGQDSGSLSGGWSLSIRTGGFICDCTDRIFVDGYDP